MFKLHNKNDTYLPNIAFLHLENFHPGAPRKLQSSLQYEAEWERRHFQSSFACNESSGQDENAI